MKIAFALPHRNVVLANSVSLARLKLKRGIKVVAFTLAYLLASFSAPSAQANTTVNNPDYWSSSLYPAKVAHVTIDAIAELKYTTDNPHYLSDWYPEGNYYFKFKNQTAYADEISDSGNSQITISDITSYNASTQQYQDALLILNNYGTGGRACRFVLQDRRSIPISCPDDITFVN